MSPKNSYIDLCDTYCLIDATLWKYYVAAVYRTGLVEKATTRASTTDYSVLALSSAADDHACPRKAMIKQKGKIQSRTI